MCGTCREGGVQGGEGLAGRGGCVWYLQGGEGVCGTCREGRVCVVLVGRGGVCDACREGRVCVVLAGRGGCV